MVYVVGFLVVVVVLKEVNVLFDFLIFWDMMFWEIFVLLKVIDVNKDGLGIDFVFGDFFDGFGLEVDC